MGALRSRSNSPVYQRSLHWENALVAENTSAAAGKSRWSFMGQLVLSGQHPNLSTNHLIISTNYRIVTNRARFITAGSSMVAMTRHPRLPFAALPQPALARVVRSPAASPVSLLTSMSVRVRLPQAPPARRMGGAQWNLYNHLFARKYGASSSCALRIRTKRYVPNSTRGRAWSGVVWYPMRAMGGPRWSPIARK